MLGLRQGEEIGLNCGGGVVCLVGIFPLVLNGFFLCERYLFSFGLKKYQVHMYEKIVANHHSCGSSVFELLENY